MSLAYTLVCDDCGSTYPPEGVRYLCASCSRENRSGSPPRGVLRAAWDYESIGSSPDSGTAPPTSFLPLESPDSLPPLTVGNTPLWCAPRCKFGGVDHRLYLKDDSLNPTYSLKDRASAVVSARAKELGIDTILAASTGNAGSSIAGICASQGQRAVVLVPCSAPRAKLVQIAMYGAALLPVEGTYDDAFDLSVEIGERTGWYNRNTAYNPLTVEGKKSVAFEMYRQLERVPDRVFVPTGDGVILSGVLRGFEDLLLSGSTDRMPRVVAVQAAGSDNLVRNLTSVDFVSRPSTTAADSISVDVPRNFHMARRLLERYHGETVLVSDEQIRHASDVLASTAGLLAEPASAAAYAGYRRWAETSEAGEESVVCLLTGSGLKDLGFFDPGMRLPQPITPDSESALRLLHDCGVRQ